MSIPTKLDRVGIYNEELLPIKPHDPLVTWSCEITWPTKTTTSLLPQCLCSYQSWQDVTNLGGLLPMLLDPLVTWSCKITWHSKPLYLHYHDAYGLQTWHGCHLRWGVLTHKVKSYVPLITWFCEILWQVVASTHNVAWRNNRVVLRDQVTKQNYYISTTTISEPTKLDRVGIYNEELPSIKSQGSLIIWSCKVTWKIRSVISLPPHGL